MGASKTQILLGQLEQPGKYIFISSTRNNGPVSYCLLEVEGALPDELGRVIPDGQVVLSSDQFYNHTKRTPVNPRIVQSLIDNGDLVPNGFVSSSDENNGEPQAFFWFRRTKLDLSQLSDNQKERLLVYLRNELGIKTLAQ